MLRVVVDNGEATATFELVAGYLFS